MAHQPPRKVTPLHDARPDVPPAISELVDRLMEKDPSRRVPSAHDVLEAIRRHYAQPSAGSSSTTTASAANAAPATPANAVGEQPALSSAGNTAPLPKRSHTPMILTGLLVFLLLLAGGLGGYIYLNRAAQQQQHRQTALDTLDKATESYKIGQYGQALDTYKQVAADWPPNTPIGAKAQAGILLVRSRVNMQDAHYEAAHDDLRQLKQMDLGSINLVSYEHVQNLLEEAQKLRQLRRGCAAHQRVD